MNADTFRRLPSWDRAEIATLMGRLLDARITARDVVFVKDFDAEVVRINGLTRQELVNECRGING